MRHKHRPKPARPSAVIAYTESAPPSIQNTALSVESIAPVLENASTRHDGWTAERQRGFCEALAQTGSVDRAAKSVGMTRETAYRLRRRDAGRAFALAWDAALLLARQLLIDEAFELAFVGSVDRIIRDGEVIGERRRRDPRVILEIIERLGSRATLGTDPVQAVAQRFDEFLDCMEADATHPVGASGRFMRGLATDSILTTRQNLSEASKLLSNMPRTSNHSHSD